MRGGGGGEEQLEPLSRDMTRATVALSCALESGLAAVVVGRMGRGEGGNRNWYLLSQPGVMAAPRLTRTPAQLIMIIL